MVKKIIYITLGVGVFLLLVCFNLTTFRDTIQRLLDLKDLSTLKNYFEIYNTKGGNIAQSLQILQPKAPFKVKAGDKVKKIVTLRTRESLQAGHYDIIIHAFAVDEKERVFVERKTNFVYPNHSKLKD